MDGTITPPVYGRVSVPIISDVGGPSSLMCLGGWRGVVVGSPSLVFRGGPKGWCDTRLS